MSIHTKRISFKECSGNYAVEVSAAGSLATVSIVGLDKSLRPRVVIALPAMALDEFVQSLSALQNELELQGHKCSE